MSYSAAIARSKFFLQMPISRRVNWAFVSKRNQFALRFSWFPNAVLTIANTRSTGGSHDEL